MSKQAQRFTVIIVPGTRRRTLTFQFSSALIGIAGLLGATLLATIMILAYSNRELRAGLAELAELKRVNRLQQAEIETMVDKAQETAGKLSELQRLEAQIRELTESDDVSRSGDAEPFAPATSRVGRGGPLDLSSQAENLPTLSAMLPPDIRSQLFASRDTLELNLRQPSSNTAAKGAALEQVRNVNSLMTEQAKSMDFLAADLLKGKKALVEQLDYQAHRPTGIPISGGLVTDRYGWRWSPFGWGRQFHNGIDFAQGYGTPVVSTGAGVVEHAGWKSGGYGYAVIINHGYGFTTLHAHLNDWNVEVGQQVKRGDLIGWVGSTGNSTGAHLHYEVHLWGVPVDPSKYL